MKSKNMKTLRLRKSIDRSRLRLAFFFTLGCIWFALSLAPTAFGVRPKPDGGYPGANTAEGDGALQSLTSGIYNTALGYHTLFSNTSGTENTATGKEALSSNTTGLYNTASGVGALYSNTTGNANNARGNLARLSHTTGELKTGLWGDSLCSR
jgi:hypothetical protein